ncbi:penicillin acylase family protein [Microbacterium marinilacus]|uniref:N-acyl homoserine lactone acylase QqaR n=1 Tax=Microbacterium marinilacus TaxID=415209 RepID=A0ABP7BRE2_9MICO|nr:penicillin acylase family protein [Microbacterium marinilacus]MBY0690407.1 penicillin acylase family protein [Microbacterium marinilacus]
MAVTLRYTSYGVPHVEADSFRELGWGIAWAHAEQTPDSLAQRWLTVRGARSAAFGADAAVGDGPAPTVTNLRSDLWWTRTRTSPALTTALSLPAPLGVDDEVRDLVDGYVDGYNAFLSERGDAGERGPTASPITADDVYARALHWNTFRSSGAMIDQLTRAAPPGADPSAPAPDFAPPPQESNMLMLGREATAHGGGMMFSNPHWYWWGPDGFRELHLTVPGVLDVYGSTVPGLPLIMTGFTPDLAFAGTSSFSQRFCLYRLELVPGRPTAYVFEGREREMTRETVTVRTEHGDVEHTFWSTLHGPLIHSERHPWTPARAYALADVALSVRWLNQQWALMRSRSLDEVDAVTRRSMAVGWRNLMAVSRDGEAFYADRTAVPHIDDAQLDDALWRPDPEARRDDESVPVLDGTREASLWGTDADAPTPGIFGADSLPQLRRADYLANQNDTHWLNSLRQPLEGFPRVLGAERTARTLRTRFALTRVESALRHGGRVRDPEHLRELLFDSAVWSAELWRADLVGLLRAQADPALAEAADVLAGWDGTEAVGSRGAVLWRAFFFALCEDNERVEASLFERPFDVRDPLRTPHGLATAQSARILAAVRAAGSRLRELGLRLDAAVEDVQYLPDGDERIPIPGGPGAQGQYNLVEPRHGAVGDVAPGEIGYGTGFLLWVDYRPDGVQAESVVVYSQSEDPTSPHHRDQSRLYASGRTKPVRFAREDVLRDTLRERRWPDRDGAA